MSQDGQSKEETAEKMLVAFSYMFCAFITLLRFALSMILGGLNVKNKSLLSTQFNMSTCSSEMTHRVYVINISSSICFHILL